MHLDSRLAVLMGLALVAFVALGFAVLGSHTTTQQTSERLGVQAQRTLAGQRPIKPGKPDPDVKVVHTAAIRAGKSTALVAVLRNTGSAPVNDLPIAAGVGKGGKPDYVNLKGTPYWQDHAPAIASAGETTWVLSGGKPLPGGTAVATVLAPKGSVTATVTNSSAVPQYKLEVYAWAKKGGRYVAAAHGEVAFLDGGADATVRVPLVGDPKGAQVHVEAPPTIFE